MDDKAQKNLDIQNHPENQDPNLPVEAQMEKAGEPALVKDQYKDSPSGPATVTSTHDRDSVQPPSPGVPKVAAQEMPLKSEEEK